MNRIREMREDKDLLQKDLAQVLNISQQQYSRYENGEMNYPMTALSNLLNSIKPVLIIFCI
mgnify:CR=1 FL=1